MSDRRWVTTALLEVPRCFHTYGESPCEAAIGITGSQKCFNSLGSCQDRANYLEIPGFQVFNSDAGYITNADLGDVIDFIESIPSLVSVELTPSRISLGEGLGQRPSITFTFRDHPHSDTGSLFDKYVSERAYDPYEQGTFWAKFAARHPNLRGKAIYLVQGLLDWSETRSYVIDSFDGPSPDGIFTITAKDPLKALDGDRAQAPAVSVGFLNADISSGATTAELSPAGVGDEHYPEEGWFNLGGTEIVSFTRSGDDLTLVRAQKNTVAVAHEAGDRVQLCLVYTAADPADIIYDLLTTYGGVAAGLIPLADWQAETAAYNGQVYTAFIPEPTAVKTLVAEVVEQAGLAVWYDEAGFGAIRLQVLRQVPVGAKIYDESQIVAGSLDIRAQPDKRKSQIWTYFGQRNPLDGLDPDNLPGVAVLIDTDAEADFGSPLAKVIYSRWIPTGGRPVAERLNSLQIGRYRTPPREVEFDLLWADGVDPPVPGAGYRLSAPSLQAIDGSRVDLPFTITRLKIKNGRITVTGEEMNWTAVDDDPLNRQIAIDYNVQNLNWRTLHDNLYGAPTPGGVVTLTIASNARVGSTSVTTPAFDTGTWPSVAFTGTRTSGNPTLTGIADTSAFVEGQAVTGAGIPNDARVVSFTVDSVTLDKNASTNGSVSLTLWTTILRLVDNGQIIGKGGKGGNGKGGDNHPGGDGGDGGLGLKATTPFDLLGDGKVDGGGGGGGAGCGDYSGWFGPQVNGGGGGGGAGDQGGNGGSSGGAGADAGRPGTSETGGDGGDSSALGYHGGDGGDPGEDGHNASGYLPGSKGLAGKAVDGASLIKDSAFTGAYRGAQIG